MGMLKTLLTWLTPSQEAQEAAIRSTMWVDRYTDYEIKLVISEMRKKAVDPRESK